MICCRGMVRMPQQWKMNLLMMLGLMRRHVGVGAFVMGAMIHAGMSVVFGLIHGGLFAALDIDSAWAAWGLLFGLAHWAVVGIALGMMPMMHPRMRSGEIDEPGFYALRYPPMTAMGFLMLHLVFGVTVGALYGAWVA